MPEIISEQNWVKHDAGQILVNNTDVKIRDGILSVENTLDEYKNKTNSAIKGIRKDIKSLVKADSYNAKRINEIDSMTYQLSNQFASHEEDIEELDDHVSELKDKMEVHKDEIDDLDKRLTKLTEIMEHMETLIENNMKTSDKQWRNLYFIGLPITVVISTMLGAIFTIIMVGAQ